MQTQNIKTILMLLCFLLIISCVKNEDFETPVVECTEPNIDNALSIENLYNNLKEGKEVIYYNQNETIAGIVISSDQAGNFYQQLIIVDEKTQKPLTIKLDVKGAFALFPVGTKVYLKLNNIYLQYNYDMITLGGGIYVASSGNRYPDVITGKLLQTNLIRSCIQLNENEFLKYINKVTIEQLLEDKTYLGKLIQIENLQFDRNIIGEGFYDVDAITNDKQGYTLRRMIDKYENSIEIRTGPYSNGFKNQIIPKESGTITGIASEYKGTIQFYPRTMKDIDLNKPPFDEEDNNDENSQENLIVNGTLIFDGADFENWQLFENQTTNKKTHSIVKPILDNYHGIAGKQSLHIQGSIAVNETLFTLTNIPSHKNATKLSFLLKGISQKTISINLYRKDNKGYDVFNIINYNNPDENGFENSATTISKSLTIKKAALNKNGNGITNYSTFNKDNAISTNGNWVKITLDITGLEYNDTGNGAFLSVRVGNENNYNIQIDELRFEDGFPSDIEIEQPDNQEDNYLANFDNWKSFLNDTGKEKIKYAELAINQGRNNKNAIRIKAKPKNNDFIFRIENKKVPKGKKKLILWIKGNSEKSLSINLYKDEYKKNSKDTDIQQYDIFNLGTISENTTINKTSRANYTGIIDTKNQWVKITLDLASMSAEYNSSTKNFVFGIKLGGKDKEGKDYKYDLLLDSIYFE
ncbi:DUF5689 domain-containing protein [Myroides injenensis]|uniref:DUF5689 domain-containing protein n=1 Tax=Myroides injenensis TaxID=1183151 RepID=UPI00226FC8B9|nr:DUF5689 domain-containing protein [Myroides injenensis]